MFADDIATPDRVDADFISRPFSDQAFATMPRVFLITQLPGVSDGFSQPFRRSAGSILLEPVM